MSNSNNDWYSIVNTMRGDAGLSLQKLSLSMGKSHSYANSALFNYSHGGAPSADVLAQFAKACGYELHLTGHGRDFLIRP